MELLWDVMHGTILLIVIAVGEVKAMEEAEKTYHDQTT